MKIPDTKFTLGDVLLLKGTELEFERALTVSSVRVDIYKDFGDQKIEVWYMFKESKFCYREDAVIKRIEPK